MTIRWSQASVLASIFLFGSESVFGRRSKRFAAVGSDEASFSAFCMDRSVLPALVFSVLCLPDADFSARNLRRASRRHCGFDNFCRRDAVFLPVDVCQRNGDFARGCFGSIADADHHRLVRF